MALKLNKQPVKGSVELSKVKSGEVVETTSKQVPLVDAVFEGPLANIGFSATYTKNLGAYESVKMSVSLHVPVRVVPGQIDEVALNQEFAFVQKWVDGHMAKLLEEADEQAG